MKKFEDLTQEEKDFWNRLAVKYGTGLYVIKTIQDRGCVRCKYKPSTWRDFEFHFHSTHGIPRDIVIDFLMHSL